MIDTSRLRGDLYGGVTAAVVALPLALAFGVASGAGALAGLYGAIFGGFFATVFGGTRVQITGPTGPMTVVMALVVTHFAGNLGAAFAVVILAGLLQLAFGLLGIGRYIKLVPQPVVSGFMTGIGVIIIIVQAGPIIGQATPPGAIMEQLAAIPALLPQANPWALAVAALVLAIMILTPRRIALFIPPPLLALLLGTLAVQIFAIEVPLIGAVPSGVPEFTLPGLALADMPYILRFALVLAFLGAIDSLLTSIVADSMTRSAHDSNRELIGQGIGNVAAGLFGGIPSAGATMRTLINIRAGGNSKLSGALHAVILLVIVLGFGGVVSLIPLPVLAGILLKVGIDIIDWRFLGRLHNAPRSGVLIMLTTLLLTVFVDLITAVAAGVVMASVLFVAKMAESQVQHAHFAFGADQIEDLTDPERELLKQCKGRLVLFHLEGPLSFGSARDVAKLIQSDLDKDVLAIDFRHVPFVDSSACAALEEVVERLNDEGDTVLLFGLRTEVRIMLEKTGVIDKLGERHIVAQRIDVIRLAQTIIDTAQTR